MHRLVRWFTHRGSGRYVWQFITLAGFHSDALITDIFARDYAKRGMLAYVEQIQVITQPHMRARAHTFTPEAPRPIFVAAAAQGARARCRNSDPSEVVGCGADGHSIEDRDRRHCVDVSNGRWCNRGPVRGKALKRGAFQSAFVFWSCVRREATLAH